ncbi:SAF domain-containing protein [Serinicoccus kebangsaanensis]|uniref:SAF domain-containing protein n=1 Tax=Serinicoccus kebangsaanensis TaxID=2602069 RepID=UPI00124F66D9|nr:SAF domain-containing protein [Serinicoccus kebangsaanensis]
MSGTGTAQEHRTVRRLQAPSWRDLRLVVGLLLVVLSVAGGARLVAGLDDTSPVYAAARDLLPGQQVEEGDLVPVPARLGEGSEHYLDGETPVTEGTYLLRAVRAGELVPASALGTQREALDKTVNVPVDASAVTGLSSGASVDVWVSRRDTEAVGEAYLDPELLLPGALVDRVAEQSGGLGPQVGQAAVALVVPADRVGDLIGAVDQDARLTLVPAPRTPVESDG